MLCDRCGGFQLRSHFQSKWGAAAWEYDGWLCLNCGEIVDPLIVLNRMVQKRLNERMPAGPYGSRVMWLRQRGDVVA